MPRLTRSMVLAVAVLAAAVAGLAPGPILSAVAAVVPGEIAGRRPAAPTSAFYHGRPFYYGAQAPQGMPVAAWLGNEPIVTGTVFMSGTQTFYNLLVHGDDPDTPEVEGPQEGDPLRFRLGGVTTNESQDFNNNENLALDLHVTKLEACVGAYDDLDADSRHDAGEPLLAGVDINVLQFVIVRHYTTTGDEATEPSCALHDSVQTVVRAVDWPVGFDPGGSSAVAITQTQGAYEVEFPFVRSVTVTPGPSMSPTDVVPTDTSTPTPTGPTPTVAPASETPTPSPSPSPSRTATATATGAGTPATATATQPTAEATTPTATEAATSTSPATITVTPSPTPIPTDVSIIVVNSTADPGTVGDLEVTLDEAMRLATGRLSPSQLSLVERQQLLGFPGAASTDLIRFERRVFPPGGNATITIQPPAIPPPLAGAPRTLADIGAVVRRSGLPELSTGGDTIDASGRGVVVAAGLGGDPFDGVVISSDGNSVRGLHLRNFNAGLVVTGEADGNVIGGPGPTDGNQLVSNIAGLVVTGPGARDNRILGNDIGVDRAGKPEGNATYGVLITAGATGNVVGEASAPNVLSANFLDGVAVLGEGSRDNRIVANRIGTNLAATESIPNGTGVVVASGAAGTVIGGPGSDGNIVSGNVAEGIWIQSTGTRGTVVQGNTVGAAADGTTPLANGGAGILVSDGARGSLIGGTAPGEGNRVAFNGEAGVRVRGGSTVRHTIRGNSITENAGPGIHLDDGGNQSLVAPVITMVDTSSVEGVASAGSMVEVFSDTADEGATLEGVARAASDGRFRLDKMTPLGGPRLNATATDPLGNTSEFGGVGPEPPTATASPISTAGPSPTATPHLRGRLYMPFLLKDQTLFTRLRLNPAASTVAVGTIQTLELQVLGAEHLYGSQIAIAFDPLRLEVIDEDPAIPGVQILPGNFPAADRKFKAENIADNAAGTIHYSFTLIGEDELNGDGLMATMRLRALAPGHVEIEFESVALSDPMALPLDARYTGAAMDILEPPTATRSVPTATSPASPTPPATATATPPPSATPPPGTPPTATLPVPTSTPATPTATATPTVTAPSTTTAPASPTVPSTATPPPTQTAVATATSPASATPPPSPTPDGCERPLVNGGFETEAAWTIRGGRPPRYVAQPRHGGEGALLLGVLPGEPNDLSYSTAWQPVAVPADARNMTVSAWVRQRAEPGGGPDRQLLLVYDVDPAQNTTAQRPPVAMVFGEHVDVDAWQRRALTIDVEAYRSQTLWIYTTVVNDGFAGRTWMVLDDAEVVFCP